MGWKDNKKCVKDVERAIYLNTPQGRIDDMLKYVNIECNGNLTKATHPNMKDFEFVIITANANIIERGVVKYQNKEYVFKYNKTRPSIVREN